MLRSVIFWAGVLCAAPSAVDAAGTAAGTVIQNTATLTYSIGGGPQQSATTPPAAFTVAELINVTLVWQDAANVAVGSPDSNRALTFLVTNTGNGPEAFSLARNNAVAGDNYDPANGSAGAIFLESGLQPGFQASGPNADTLYVAGNNPTLAADAGRIVYIVSDTPAALVTGNVGRVELSVAATTPGAAGSAPGTTLVGLGQGGVDAVVGATRAQARQTGGYIVGGVAVTVAKSVVSVVDPAGGTTVRSGSIVTYRIVLSVNGGGTADNLALDDPLPASTTYVTNSISVNGTARTDAVDADSAEFSSGAVKARFGNTAAPISHTVEFRVTVN